MTLNAIIAHFKNMNKPVKSQAISQNLANLGYRRAYQVSTSRMSSLFRPYILYTSLSIFFCPLDI